MGIDYKKKYLKYKTKYLRLKKLLGGTYDPLWDSKESDLNEIQNRIKNKYNLYIEAEKIPYHRKVWDVLLLSKEKSYFDEESIARYLSDPGTVKKGNSIRFQYSGIAYDVARSYLLHILQHLSVRGWGDLSVEEISEILEYLYNDTNLKNLKEAVEYIKNNMPYRDYNFGDNFDKVKEKAARTLYLMHLNPDLPSPYAGFYTPRGDDNSYYKNYDGVQTPHGDDNRSYENYDYNYEVPPPEEGFLNKIYDVVEGWTSPWGEY